jgi:hypothetical protein
MYCFKNSSFIDKLEDQIGNDIILFGADCMSYFGNLSDVTENAAVLTAADLSSSGLVEIRNPSEAVAGTNTSSIKLINLVGFGYNLTADPFVYPPQEEEGLGPAVSSSDVNVQPTEAYSDDKCFCHHSKLEIPTIISTFGGFIAAGGMINMDKNIAELDVEYIFAPGGDGNTLFAIDNAVINLRAATAFSS